MSRWTLTQQCWSSMKQRCFNPKAQEFKNYGARGITVCDRWMKFANFLSDMGEKPAGLSIERIDNNGNYEPSNCRWATKAEQCCNRRDIRFLEFNGERLPMRHMADKFGIDKETVRL